MTQNEQQFSALIRLPVLIVVNTSEFFIGLDLLELEERLGR